VFTGFVEHEEVPRYVSAANVAVPPYNPRGFKESGDREIYMG